MRTKTEIAKQADITYRHLARILAGTHTPSVKAAIRLDIVTGISCLTWVLGTGKQRRAEWKKKVEGK